MAAGPKYPKSMYRLVDGVIASEVVADEAHELAHAANGWSPKVPVIPQHNASGVPMQDDSAAAIGGLAEGMAELGERIAQLAARVEKLEQQKRGPGRPPKEDK